MSNTVAKSEQDYQILINNPEPIDADAPDYKEIFSDLQGGIIKSYGRNYYLYLFISFDKGKVKEAKEWIRDEVSHSVTSTQKQFQDTGDYRNKRQEIEARLRKQEKEIDINSLLAKEFPGNLCKNFYLSAQGYKTLFGFKNINSKWHSTNSNAIDSQFSAGMKDWWEDNYQTDDNINDSDSPRFWDVGGNCEIHALLLLAHDSLEELNDRTELIVNEFKRRKIGNVVACEVGGAIRENGRVIGPFGFADNISQPLFLTSDYDLYRSKHNTDEWNPKASLSLVLEKDPFGEPYSFGSYCVWQKLETDYQRFKELEEKLAETLRCDQELAAALVVGRFRDGTPIVLHPNQQNKDSVENDFNYKGDPHGTKCPFHAHIRKVNRRKETENDSRIFRASVTYFDGLKAEKTSCSKDLHLCLEKLKHLREVSQVSVEKQKESIRGLLFVCFQSSIVNQFQRLQLDWADRRDNNESLDPVIGHPITSSQQSKPEPQKWPNRWDGEKEDFSSFLFHKGVNSFLKNKGGEFFFAPSISFLKNVLEVGD